MTWVTHLPLVTTLVLAYVLGAIPVSHVVARLTARVDLRGTGLGTVSPWNLYHAVGLWPAVLAGAIDVGKGVLGPVLVGRDDPWLAAVAGMLTVCGHNWSPLLKGGGGRGLSPATGALAVVAWPGAVVMCAGLLGGIIARRVVGAMSFAVVMVLPVLAITSGPVAVATAGVIVAPIVVKTMMLVGQGRIHPRRYQGVLKRWRNVRLARPSQSPTGLDGGGVPDHRGNPQ